MIWAIYYLALALTMMFAQLTRRSTAHIRDEVRMELVSDTRRAALLALDMFVMAASFSLLVAPFWLIEPWWAAVTLIAVGFIIASVATGLLTARLLPHHDMAELYLRCAWPLGASALLATGFIWVQIAGIFHWF